MYALSPLHSCSVPVQEQLQLTREQAIAMRAVHKALGSNLKELFSERLALVSSLQVLKAALLRSPMLKSSIAAPVCCPDWAITSHACLVMDGRWHDYHQAYCNCRSGTLKASSSRLQGSLCSRLRQMCMQPLSARHTLPLMHG